MGLNNIHLEFKVDGTAASQRNSMAYTRDRWGEKIVFYYLTPAVNGSMVGCMEE